MSYIWLGGVILFAIIEAATMGINFIWFSVGCLAAMTATMCGAEIWLQLVVFVIVTGAALWFTRPLVKKYINSKHQPTNADRIIGCQGFVTEEIDNSLARGQVRANGQIWSAKSNTDKIIPVGKQVEITGISGVKAIVKQID